MHASRRDGFTLAEVIVATTATVLVAGATMGMLRSVTGVGERANRQMAAQHQARVAVTAIATALGNIHRAGEGRTALRGMDAALDEKVIPVSWPRNVEFAADRLRFFAVTHRQIRDEQPESDVKEMEFFLAVRELGEAPVLMQRIDPTRNPDEDEGGVVFTVAENVLGLDIAYHDGQTWLPEWTADRNEWPLAVRISVTVSADGSAERPWTVSRVVSFPHRPQEQDGGREGGDARMEATE